MSADLGGDEFHPTRDVGFGVLKALPLDALDSPRAVVLVERGLQTVEHFRVVLGEGARADEPHLLGSPMPHQNRALRFRIRSLQDAHRLQHRDGACTVVGGSRRRVPRVEVG